MIRVTTTDKKMFQEQLSCYVFFIKEGELLGSLPAYLKDVQKEYVPDLFDVLSFSEFTGKKFEKRAIPFIAQGKLVHALFIGLGKPNEKKKYLLETFRRALALASRLASAHRCESMGIAMPSANLFDVTPEELGQQTTTIVNMASYHFKDYISADDETKKKELLQVSLFVDAKNKKDIAHGVKTGEIIAQAVNKARHWVDLPPSDLTPPHLSDKAEKIAKDVGLKITIFNEKEINKMGMGGLAGVSRGSDQDCRLLIMEYKTKKKNAPTLAFVGKGITFDSGGLSLKPPTYMETMKEDMSGAAAVIAAMQAIGTLKPDVNVIGVTPLAENLPSGKATKPGDIVRFYNGKTAEVRNTDAEGRLILADALSYVVKHYKPDMIIDLATLTGACAYALGPFFSGMMSEHDDLVKKIEQAATHSGDHVWRLPMHDDYKVAIKSDVADMCNIGSNKYMAGAITAAHFLQHFVGDTPWVHLDIAGTAFNVPDIPYYRPGATGVGVRLLIDLALHWK